MKYTRMAGRAKPHLCSRSGALIDGVLAKHPVKTEVTLDGLVGGKPAYHIGRQTICISHSVLSQASDKPQIKPATTTATKYQK